MTQPKPKIEEKKDMADDSDQTSKQKANSDDKTVQDPTNNQTSDPITSNDTTDQNGIPQDPNNMDID